MRPSQAGDGPPVQPNSGPKRMLLAFRPSITTSSLGWEEVGYAPHRHFGTFLAELRRLDAEIGEAAVRALRCDY